MYIFDSLELLQDHSLPKLMQNFDIFTKVLSFLGTDFAWQYYLGPPLSAAPFHSHGSAINLIIFGRKQWALLPPAMDFFSSVPPLEAMKNIHLADNIYPYDSGACYIVQNAGEMLFVPRHWSHQVVNLQETIGFAVEILQPVYL